MLVRVGPGLRAWCVAGPQVTFAAGLACEGLVPFCTIYSTFLQRGFDQVVHDVALQDLPGAPLPPSLNINFLFVNNLFFSTLPSWLLPNAISGPEPSCLPSVLIWKP